MHLLTPCMLLDSHGQCSPWVQWASHHVSSNQPGKGRAWQHPESEVASNAEKRNSFIMHDEKLGNSALPSMVHIVSLCLATTCVIR